MNLPKSPDVIALVLRGFPRLSEPFIAQEICALEERGLHFQLWSLSQPKDIAVHPIHRRVHAAVTYLPERLYQAPLRLLRAGLWALYQPQKRAFFDIVVQDFKRDRTFNRFRRIMQALILAYELPAGARHIHAYHLHTPASVARYAAVLTGRTWSFSAQAKDIWLLPDWEKREKLASSLWGVASTALGCADLLRFAPKPDHVSLAYHGLDLRRFPPSPATHAARTGTDSYGALRLLSVGRATDKKGYDDLIRALAALPKDLAWQFAHVGDGPLLDRLKDMVRRAGLSRRVAFMGAMTHPKIIELMRAADIFILPCRQADNGDRDALPNVLLEAASQQLAIITTDFSAIPEFIRNGVEGYLVPPGDWESLSNTLNTLMRDPERRLTLGSAAHLRLMQKFSMDAGISVIEARMRRSPLKDLPPQETMTG